jgi:hypothetical protein
MTWPSGRKKTSAGGCFGQNFIPKIDAYFITCLMNTWADGSLDVHGTQLAQRMCGLLKHATNGTAPPGMGRAYGSIIAKKQDWCAIGGDNSKGQSREPGNKRIGGKAFSFSPWRGDGNHFIAVDLLQAKQGRGRHAQHTAGPSAILPHA